MRTIGCIEKDGKSVSVEVCSDGDEIRIGVGESSPDCIEVDPSFDEKRGCALVIKLTGGNAVIEVWSNGGTKFEQTITLPVDVVDVD